MKRLLFLALALITLTANAQKKVKVINSKTALSEKALSWQPCDTSLFPLQLVEDRYRFQYLDFICSTQTESNANLVLHNPKNKGFVDLFHAGQNGKFLGVNGSGVVGWQTLPSSPTSTYFASYSAGTPYNLTTTSSKITFGTTSPQITLTSPGTYSIRTNVLVGYTGLVSVGTRTLNVKLRRTNNTASDLTNASTDFVTPAASVALTSSAGDVDVPEIFYTTSNSNDVIELWGSISAAISLGNIQAQQASITVTKISN